jgi:hypothetical protein
MHMTRRRSLVVLVVVIVIGIVIWFRPHDRVTASSSSPAAVQVSVPRPSHRIAASEMSADDRPELPFHITGIEVEKSVLCRGEQTVVRMTGTHEDPAEQLLLQPLINGSPGWEAPIHLNERVPGRYPVTVILRGRPGDPDPGQTKTFYVELKDCVAPFNIKLRSTPIDHLLDTYSFEAAVVSGPAYDKRISTDWMGLPPPPLSPVDVDSYLWELGDGTSETTREPTIRHRYPSEEERPEGEATHAYFVRVSALDRSGQLMGSAGDVVVLRNTYRELALLYKRIQLRADNPPLAQPGRGQGRIAITLKNLDPSETAILEELEVKLLDCTAEMNVLSTSTRTTAAMALPSRVPPGGTVVWDFVWPDAMACRIQVITTGHSEPSKLPVDAITMYLTGRPTADAVPIADISAQDLIRTAQRAYPAGHGVGRKEFEELEAKGVIPAGSWAKLERIKSAHQP